MSRPLLCFPLDYPSVSLALQGAELVAASVDVLKVGLELFIEGGPEIVRRVQTLGCGVFLDLKLHDIPQTVERAVARAAELGVNYLTVHTGGGPAMLSAAVRGIGRAPLTLLGVTVLTSLDDAELRGTGIDRSPLEQTLLLAQMAAQHGVEGFVASAHEAAALRQHIQSTTAAPLQIVTPGIRPAGGAAGDQRRIATPTQAVLAGASMLVVGRPIRDAAAPAEAAQVITAEIERAYQQHLTQQQAV